MVSQISVRYTPMTSLSSDIAFFAECDEAIIENAKNIKLLSSLSWPNGVQEEFLGNWHRGRATLPKISYPTQSFGEMIANLSIVQKN